MKFATMQIFETKEIEQFYNIGSFSGIKFSLRDDPSKLHYCGENGRARTRIMKYPHEEEDLIDGILAKELIIEGCSEGEAYNLSRFVQAGCLLGYPSISDYPEPRIPHEYEFVLESRKISKEAEIKTFNYYYADEPIRSNLFIGCSIAKKAYGNLSLMYCLEKYLFSLSLSSVTPHSIHPMYGNLFSSDPQSYSSHVRDVYAFLSAYSIVEELQVEIRSSQSNPRWQDGEWNHKVKESVLDRLKKFMLMVKIKSLL